MTPDWQPEHLEPDNWLQIPEFGVRPQDVDFEGFAFPILAPDVDWWGTCLIEIREMVGIARDTARREFSTLEQLHRTADSVLDMTEEEQSALAPTSPQMAAAAYLFVMDCFATARARVGSGAYEQALRVLAQGSSYLAMWLAGMKPPALLRQLQGAARGGRNSAKTRQDQTRVPDRDTLIKERDALIAGGTAKRETVGKLAQRYHCDASTIRKKLKAKK